MISQTAEYALRAMVSLAKLPELSRPCHSLAKECRVPSGYLHKILKQLVSRGLITSKRGLNGGFTLNFPPEKITILQVINAVDPIKRIESCPLNLPEHCESLCPLHSSLDNAIAMICDTFSNTSLAEIASGYPDTLKLLNK